MKKFLQKSCAWLVMLVAMFAMSMSAMAQDATFSMSSGSFDLVANQGQATQVTAKGSMTSWSGFAEFNGDGHFLVLECQGNYEITKVVFTGVAGWNASIYASQMKVKDVSEEIGALTLTYEVFKWEGNSKIVRFEQNGSQLDVTFSGCQVWLTAVAPSDPITYTVNFTGEVPAGCSATLGEDTFSSNWSKEVAQDFNESDLNITTTADYYADVTYAAENHTWTVEFKPWLVYTVELTIPSYHPNAAVGYQGSYYENGQTIKSKTALTADDLEVYDLNGYDESVTVEGNIVKVVYTESAPITYTVTFNAVPEGAYAWINGVKYDASTTFQTNLELSESNIQEVHCPEGYYASSYYSATDHTFYINFIEYDKYYVVVEGTDDANAGVKYDYNTYHNGDVIYSTFTLYDYYVTAVDVTGYNVEVSLNDHTITVTYTEKPVPTAPWSITFDAEGQAQCQIVDKNGYNTWNTSSDYDYSTYQYVPCFKYNYTDYAAANDFIILPAVKLEAGKSYTVTVNTRCESATWAERMEVVYGTVADVDAFNKTAIPNTTVNWTSRKDLSGDISVDADGKYYFAIHATSNAGMYYLYAYSFSIEEAAGPEPRDCVMTLTAMQPNVPGEVSSIGSNISFTCDVNTEGHHYGYGTPEDVPEGMTMTDGFGNNIAIAAVRWWDNDSQVGVVFNNGITTPGTYTLTIPEGVIPCVDNKANKAMTFTWTVVAPAPEFPKQGVDYKIALYNSVVYSDGGYLNVVTDNGNNGTVRRDTPEALNFTWDGAEGAFTIQDKEGNYIGGATGSNTWSCMPSVKEYWTVEEITDGVYAFKSKTSGYLGFNSVGGNAFRDMQKNNKRNDRDYYDEYMFTIEEILYPVATFNMSAAGWATLCISQAFTVPEDYKAYTVGKLEGGVSTLAEGDQIVLTEVYDVPAGTPVLIEGPAATDIELYAPEYTPVHTQVNFLWGNGNDVAVTYYAASMADYGHGTYDVMEDLWENGTFGPCQLYQLAKENDKVGFYRQVEDGITLQCGAHKAFLVVPSDVAASNSRFLFPGQEGTTGIDTVLAPEAGENIYNLQGQRVNTAKNGVFVKNGRKVIVK